jgi:hypothetical protein
MPALIVGINAFNAGAHEAKPWMAGSFGHDNLIKSY